MTSDLAISGPCMLPDGARHYQLDDLSRRGSVAAASAGLERGIRPVRRSPRRDTRLLHVRRQFAPDWVTPSGVAKKRKLLERKGLPDFAGWRFITLTIDPELFGHCPMSAYMAGKDRMRRFLDLARHHAIWSSDAKWCWKLEFTAQGYAHWHLLVERKTKFSHSQLRKLDALWSLGRTHVRRISKSNFGYTFKYAYKAVYQDDGDGFALPSWFLDYYTPSSDGSKPKSFARVRFWQTSRGFYSATSSDKFTTKKKLSSIVPRSLRDQHINKQLQVVVIARTIIGKYIKSASLYIRPGADIKRSALWCRNNDAGWILGPASYALPEIDLKRILHPTHIHTLCLIAQTNRLTHRSANRLRHNRQTLMRC
jgi:hypothetical protein